jgi:hypothetical protein
MTDVTGKGQSIIFNPDSASIRIPRIPGMKATTSE